jgi:hypothetical protein
LKNNLRQILPSPAIFPTQTQKTHGTRIADKSFVARKFQASGTVRGAADFAAMNLRMATMQLAGMRVPPRVRTVPSLRRRLTVTEVSDPPQPIIIRHVVQNVGRQVNETRPIQSPRV